MYRIPFHIRLGLFIRLCMNPIHSASTIRYNSAPHQQVVRKWIRYNPYSFVSCVNIVIRYETLPNLALIIGWLQSKWDWSIPWQIGNIGGRNEIILAWNSVTVLFSKLRVNSFAFSAQDSRKRSGKKVIWYRVNQAWFSYVLKIHYM